MVHIIFKVCDFTLAFLSSHHGVFSLYVCCLDLTVVLDRVAISVNAFCFRQD